MQNKNETKTFYFIEMKSFLCSSNFQDKQKPIEHYLTYHNVDQNNWFFKKLFIKDNKAFLRNCIRCDEFLTTKKEKAAHDFIKHCDDGKEIPFEEKPLDIIKFPALTIYKIEFKKYKNQCSFFNAEKCVNDFLKNGQYRFRAINKKWFRCSFTIENTQNSIRTDLPPLTNTRYWTTETYDSIYFNDFILHSLRSDILKRAIANQMSGSSWYFKRFSSLAVKTLDSEIDISFQ